MPRLGRGASFSFFFFLGFARQAGVKKGGSQVRGPLLQGSPKSNICTKLCLAGGYKVWLVVVVGCLARMERRGVVCVGGGGVHWSLNLRR
jgi:hypothetical protein